MSTTYVDVAYCYRRSNVVYRSVTVVSPAKTAEPIEMSFAMWIEIFIKVSRVTAYLFGLDNSSVFFSFFPLPSSRHRLSYDDCLEDKRENYQNCFGFALNRPRCYGVTK